MTKLNFAAAIAAALLGGLLAGCSDNSRVVALEARLTALEADLQQVKAQLDVNEVSKDWAGTAYLTPGSEGHSLLKTDLGPLVVSLKGVQAHALGTRVSFQFGNLTAASIDGLKARLYWVPADKNGKRSNQEAKSREVSFLQSMPSGSWTTSEVLIEGVQPSELGYIAVRDVAHQGLRLRKAAN